MNEEVQDHDSFFPSTTRPPGQKAAAQQKYAREDDTFVRILEPMQESMVDKTTSMNGFMTTMVDIMSATSGPIANDPYVGLCPDVGIIF